MKKAIVFWIFVFSVFASSSSLAAVSTYDFNTLCTGGSNCWAYPDDVDQFEFGWNAGNRNTHTEIGSYAGIASSDDTRYTTVDPGNGDEIFFWLEMTVAEDIARIDQIDFTFEGHLNGVTTDFSIYALQDGATWQNNGSWDQLGAVQSITSNTDTSFTRTITSGFGTYINASTGLITWGIYEVASSTSEDVDYVSMVVTYNAPPVINIDSSSQTSTNGSGEVTLQYDLTDAENDTCRLLVEYSYDGVTWYQAYIKSASVGTVSNTGVGGGTSTGQITGITTPRSNVTFVWDTKNANNENGAFTGTDTSVYLRVTPYDTRGSATAGTSAAFTVDNQAPAQSAWLPASGDSVCMSNPTVTFTLDENGDCKWSTTDQAYSAMTNDCTGDGTTSISCALSGLAVGANNIYFSCSDTAYGNGDTAGTNTLLSLTRDANPPDQSNWNPAKGTTLYSSNQTVTFDLDKRGDCKWSLTDGAYGSMSNDCTGDGTTSISCDTVGLQAGAEIVYIACQDLCSNADTAGEQVNYTVVNMTTYDFSTCNPGTDCWAYTDDVDRFTFGNNAGNRNTHPEVTNYAQIASSDNSRYYVGSPGFNDEIFTWIEMNIAEDPARIDQIDLIFEGYMEGATTNFSIYALQDGAAWQNDASWDQIGTSQSITSYTDTSFTRSITSNFSNYINASTGLFTWGIAEAASSVAEDIDYVGLRLTYNAAPVINIDSASQTSTNGTGEVTLQYDLSDSEADTCRLLVEYSYDGVTWYQAYIKSASVGTVSNTGVSGGTSTGQITGITTPRTNVTFVWDTQSASNENGAFTGEDTTVYLRVVPYDTRGSGTTGTSAAFTVDNQKPTQSNWSPAGGDVVCLPNPSLTFDLDSNGDCKWATTDLAYSAMTNDCTGDGTTSITCNLSGLAAGANNIYVACSDSPYGNADSASTNVLLSLTRNNNPPTQSNWSPAKGSSMCINNPSITFDLDKKGDCKWSLTDGAYSSMTNDCTGDGTTSITCDTSGLSTGAEIVYIACQDLCGDADTSGEQVNYTVASQRLVITNSAALADPGGMVNSPISVNIESQYGAGTTCTTNNSTYLTLSTSQAGTGSFWEDAAMTTQITAGNQVHLTSGALTVYYKDTDYANPDPTITAADTAGILSNNPDALNIPVSIGRLAWQENTPAQFNAADSSYNVEVFADGVRIASKTNDAIPVAAPVVLSSSGGVQWKYRIPVNITEPGIVDRVNAPVRICVAIPSPGTDDRPNSLASAQAQIRVVNGQNTEVPSSVESWGSCAANSAEIIFLASVNTSETKTYYVYYGNGSATTPGYTTNTPALVTNTNSLSDTAATKYYSRINLPIGMETYSMATRVDNGCDDCNYTRSLPWTIRYFNQNVNAFRVSTNGLASVGAIDNTASYSNYYDNTSGATFSDNEFRSRWSGVVAPMWLDLMPTTIQNPGIFEERKDAGLATDRFMYTYRTCRWTNVNDIYIFQMIFYKTGDIAFRYEEVDSPGTNTHRCCGNGSKCSDAGENSHYDCPINEEWGDTRALTSGISNGDNTYYLRNAQGMTGGVSTVPTFFYQNYRAFDDYGFGQNWSVGTEEPQYYNASFLSSVWDSGSTETDWGVFNWTETLGGTPASDIIVTTRSGSTSTPPCANCGATADWSAWEAGPTGYGWTDQSFTIESPINRYLQYRVIFKGTSDANSPTDYPIFGGMTVGGNNQIVIANINAPAQVGQGESGIDVTMDVVNQGRMTANCTAASLSFSQGTYTQTVFTPSLPVSIPQDSTQTITFHVDVDTNSATGTANIDGAVTCTFGATTLSSNNAVATDSWVVLDRANLRVDYVETDPVDLTEVIRGQTGKTLYMKVTNTGQVPADITDSSWASLNFCVGSYTTTISSPSVPLTVNGGTSATFTFSVDIHATSPTGLSIIDGHIRGVDQRSGAVTADETTDCASGTYAADSVDAWTIQTPASIAVTAVDTSPTTVNRGQHNIPVTMRIINFGQESAIVNAAYLTFSLGTYTGQAAPATPTLPITLAGGASQTLTFYVSVDAASAAGTATLDGQVFATGSITGWNLSDTSASTKDYWVIGDSAMMIYRDAAHTVEQYSFNRGVQTAYAYASGLSQNINVEFHWIDSTGASVATTTVNTGIGGTAASSYAIPGAANTGDWTLEIVDAALPTSVFASNYFTVVTPAALTTLVCAAGDTSPCTTAKGVNYSQTFQVITYITNNGGATANNVTPTALTQAGTAGACTCGAVSPASANIAGGTTQAFTYNCTAPAAGAGTRTFTNGAAGTDANTSGAVTSANDTSNTVNIGPAAILGITNVVTTPTIVNRCQTNITVTSAVTNTAAAGGASLSLTAHALTFTNGTYAQTRVSPTLPVTLAPGGSQTLTYDVAVDCSSNTGASTLSAVATASDLNSGSSLTDNAATTTDSWTVQPEYVQLFRDAALTAEQYSYNRGQTVYMNGGGLPLSKNYLVRWYSDAACTTNVLTSSSLNSGTTGIVQHQYTTSAGATVPATYCVRVICNTGTGCGTFANGATVVSNYFDLTYPAALTASFTAPAAGVTKTVGQTVGVTLNVTNCTNCAEASGVYPPTLSFINGTCGGTVGTVNTSCTPTPSSADINGGSSQSFSWTCYVTGGGTGQFRVNPGSTGSDSNNGNTITAAAATSNCITIQSLPSLTYNSDSICMVGYSCPPRITTRGNYYQFTFGVAKGDANSSGLTLSPASTYGFDDGLGGTFYTNYASDDGFSSGNDSATTVRFADMFIGCDIQAATVTPYVSFIGSDSNGVSFSQTVNATPDTITIVLPAGDLQIMSGANGFMNMPEPELSIDAGLCGAAQMSLACDSTPDDDVCDAVTGWSSVMSFEPYCNKIGYSCTFDMTSDAACPSADGKRLLCLKLVDSFGQESQPPYSHDSIVYDTVKPQFATFSIVSNNEDYFYGSNDGVVCPGGCTVWYQSIAAQGGAQVLSAEQLFTDNMQAYNSKWKVTLPAALDQASDLTDDTSPYTQTYTVTAGNTTNYLSRTITIYDYANNTETSTINIRNDNVAPANPTAGTGWTDSSKTTALTSGSSYSNTAPYFEWSGDNDTGGSGVRGYYAKLSTNSAYVPVAADYATAASYQAATGSLVCGSTYYMRVRTRDNVNNTPATASTVFSYIYDNQPPSITDNQTGDDVWRGAAGTTYDVDFSDSCGQLDYVQYSVWTGAGMTGTQLLSWTNIASGIAAGSYTTNWGVDFSALQEGTNYVSVRAYDYASNTVTATDVFYIRKDTVPPTFSYNDPSDGGTLATWYGTGAAASVDIDLLWASGSPIVQLDYSPVSSGVWYNVWSGSQSADYTTDWGMAAGWGDLWNGENQVSIRGIDEAGNIATHTFATGTAGFIVRRDSLAPDTPPVPVNGWASSLKSIVLTDSDPTGYAYINPYFEWSVPDDNPQPLNSGLSGYLVGFSTDPAYDPTVFQTNTSYTAATPTACNTNYYLRIKTADSAVPPSTSTAVTAFTYKIVGAISIFDNQSGDDTWRNANTGVYDIDFTDSCGFDLDYIQYSIWSAEDMGSGTGTQLLGWTTFLGPGLSQAAYYNNWALSAAAFDSATDGVNFVSIKAYDTGGLIEYATDVFYLLKDTIGPPSPAVSGYDAGAKAVTLTDGGWHSFPNPYFEWSAVTDLPSPLNSGAKDSLVYFGTDSAGVPDIATTDLNFTSTATLVTGYTYYLRISSRDNLNNTGTATTVFTYKYDVTAPDNPAAPVNGWSDNSKTTAINEATAYNYTYPYFEWTAPDDLPATPANSGVSGYLVDFSTDSAYTPVSFQTATSFQATATLCTDYYLRIRTSDNAVTPSTSTAVTAFHYIRTGNPSIADNQAGDDTWRAANSATYDVDFTANCGLDLDYLQYSIWSAAGMGSGTGTELVSWTTFQGPGVGANTYSTDWSLLGADFTSAADGINWISVKAVDVNGQTSVATDVFYVLKDTVPPDNPTAADGYDTSGKAVSLTDGNWYNYPNPYFEWSASSDLPAALNSGLKQYVIYFGTDSAGAPDYATTATSYTATQTLVSGETYYLRIKSMDNVDNATSATTLFSYKYDSAPPAFTYNSPAAGGNTSWYSADPGAIVNIDLGLVPTGSPLTAYRYRIGAGAWNDIWTGTQSSDYTSDWSATWASLAEGENQISISGWDEAGNGATDAYAAGVTGFLFRKDVSAPDNPATPVNGWASSTKLMAITNGSSYIYTNPYFEWTAPSDNPLPVNSGVAGYLVGFSTDPSFVPTAFQTTTSYQATTTTCGTDFYLRIRTVDSAIPPSTSTTVTAFTYGITGGVNIIDNQSGDDTWRAANSAVYDVDFSDSCAFDLDYVQYTIWSAAAMGSGTGTEIVPWTTFLGPALSGTSYTADWSILNADFTAAADGINWVTIRAFDSGGLTSVATDAFYILKDTVPPDNPSVAGYDTSGKAVTLTDGNWYGYANPYFEWSAASDLPAALNSGVKQYVLYFGTDSAGVPDYATSAISYTATQTLVSGQTYYLRIKTVDNVDNATSVTTVFTYKYDSTPPAFTYNSPTAGGNTTWYSADPGSIVDIDLGWGGSGSPLTAYRYRIGAGAWNDIWTGSQSSDYTTDWSAAWASLAEGENQISVSGRDNAGNGATDAYAAGLTGFLFRKDVSAPDNPSAPVSGWDTSAKGTALTSGSSYLYMYPYFEWTAPNDNPLPLNSGVSGYLVGFSTDSSFDPVDFQTSTSFTATPTACNVDYYLRIKTADSAVPPSTSTAITAFQYRLSGGVSIIDNQTGDNTWRRTNAATYDVDFADSCFFDLDYAQYSIWTAAGMGSGTGTQLVGWTTFLGPSLTGTSYTANWSLLNPDFASMADGINWISVRAYDAGGLNNTATDVFYVLKDTVPPNNPAAAGYDTSGKAVTLTDSNWYNYANPYFEWSAASDLPAALNSGVAQYLVYFGTDPAGVPDIATTAIEFTSTATLVTGYTYYLRLTTSDNAGNATSASTVFTYKYDSTAPNNPSVTAYDSPSKAATLTDGNWYNHAYPYFEWAAPSDLPAAPASSGIQSYGVYFGTDSSGAVDYSTTTAAYAATQTLVDGETYYLRIGSVDNAGNAAAEATVFTYKYDPTPPAFVYNSPTAGGYTAWYSSAPGSIVNVDLQWGSGSPLASYSYRIGAGAWTSIWSGTQSADYTTDWGVTWASLAEGENQISVAGHDTAGNGATDSFAAGVSGFIFGKDLTAPDNPAAALGWATDGMDMPLISGDNYFYSNPYFEWTPPSDNPAPANAGVGYYYVGFSTDPDYDPTATQSYAHYYATPTVCGQTYYLVVKTADAAIPSANVAATTSKLFSYRFSASPPVITDGQAGDDTWRRTNPGAAYNVDFMGVCNPLDYVQYVVYSEPGMTGTKLKDWTYIAGPGYGANSYSANWGVDWASLQEGVNYISVKAADTAGDMSVSTDVFYIKKDTIVPTISTGAYSESSDYLWVSPANGKMYYGTGMAGAEAFSLIGTATDTTTGALASGLATATFSAAFGDTPAADTSPAAWSGAYDISASDSGGATLTVTIYDLAGNSTSSEFIAVHDNSLSIEYATISKDWRPSYAVFNVYYPDGVTELTATGATGIDSTWLKVYSVSDADVTSDFSMDYYGYDIAACEQASGNNALCMAFIANACRPAADDPHHIGISGSSTANGFNTTLAGELSTDGDLADGTFQATNGPDYLQVKPVGDGLITADTRLATWCSGGGCSPACAGAYCSVTADKIPAKPEYVKYDNGGATRVALANIADNSSPGALQWSWDTSNGRIIIASDPSSATVSYTPDGGSEEVCVYVRDACDEIIDYGRWEDTPVRMTMSQAPDSGKDVTENKSSPTQGFTTITDPAGGDLSPVEQTTVQGTIRKGTACVVLTATSVPSDTPATPIRVDASYYDEITLATGTLLHLGGEDSPGMVLIRPGAGVASGTTSFGGGVTDVSTIFTPSATDTSASITLAPAWNSVGDKLAFISRQSNPCGGAAASGDTPFYDFNIYLMKNSGGAWTDCVRLTRNTTDGVSIYGPRPYSEVAWSPAGDKVVFAATSLGFSGQDKLYWISATSAFSGAATGTQVDYVVSDPNMIADTLTDDAPAGHSTVTVNVASAFTVGQKVLIGEFDTGTNEFDYLEIKRISAIDTADNQITFSTPFANTYSMAGSGSTVGMVQYPVTLDALGQDISSPDLSSNWYDPSWSPSDAAAGCVAPPDPASLNFGDALIAVRQPGDTSDDIVGAPPYSSDGNTNPNIVMLYGAKNADGVYQYNTSSIMKITDFSGNTIQPLKPKWSPDCSKIAFVAWDRSAGDSPARTSIYVINMRDTRAGWATASLPVTSLSDTGVYKVYDYASNSAPAYFPNWSADSKLVSYSIDVTNTFDVMLMGADNNSFVEALFNNADFDSYLEYIEDQPAGLGGIVAPQIIGRAAGTGGSDRNEFGMVQCPGGLTGSACTNGPNYPYSYIAQNHGDEGKLRVLTVTNASTVNQNGGLLFLDGIVTAVFPPGVISSDTVFWNEYPAKYCLGSGYAGVVDDTAGGGTGLCPVEPTGEYIVKAGDAREFFPDGTNFNGYVRLIFKYCDNDDDGKIDTGTEGTQAAAFTYNGTTCQIGGVDTATGTVDVDSIAVYNWDDTQAKWIKLEGLVNRSEKTITVYSTHFSRYDTFGFRFGAQPASFTPLQLSNIHTYPNPWRTTDGAPLRFAADTAAGDGPVSIDIKVYDIRGSEVAAIRNVVARTGAGYTTDSSASGNPVVLAEWDARNSAGRPLASGVYLYYMQATDTVNGTVVTTTGKLSILH